MQADAIQSGIYDFQIDAWIWTATINGSVKLIVTVYRDSGGDKPLGKVAFVQGLVAVASSSLSNIMTA